MPRKGYRQTKEHIEKTKQLFQEGKIGFQKGHPVYGGFQKGHPLYSKNGCFKKGNKPWNTGKMTSGASGKHWENSEEIRKKIRGKNHYNWKGGITPENVKIRQSIEYRFWVEGNMARDNYTCQKCGQCGGKLQCHHILNFAEYPELRFAIDNGITFCQDCHKKFHRKYGIKNNNLEQIKEFVIRNKC